MFRFLQRRSITISAFVSVMVMGLAITFTNAHDVPLDELGCHRDPPGGRYHCHVGQLKGREFSSKDEAERVVMATRARADDTDFAVTVQEAPGAAATKVADAVDLPPPPAPMKAVLNPELLKVISWKIKKSAPKLDYDRIVNILAEADIAILQGLDLDEVGKGPLHITGDVLQRRINEKICRLWFRNSSGAKESFGVLWRDSTVGYVEKGGAIREHCGEMAVIVPIAKKKDENGIASSLFYSKVQKKMFVLGTVDLNSRLAHPDRDIPSLFSGVDARNWPAIVTGDLKTSTHSLKKWDYVAAMAKSTKKTFENIWTKNAVVVHSTPVDIYERFSEIKSREVDQKVSEHFPMLAEVALVSEPNDKIQTMIIRSKKDKRSSSRVRSKPVVVSEAHVKDQFDNPNEDIEAEANDADGVRAPATGSTPKKKTKKRKKQHKKH